MHAVGRVGGAIWRLWLWMLRRMYSERTAAAFYRRQFGMRIGAGCRICDTRVDLFGSEPFLVEIGDGVTISDGARFVTHDGGVTILRAEHPGLNVYGRIVVRDNCFLGLGSIILPGVTVGPNAVVGAGAVVTRDVPANSVVAGVPARVVRSLEEYTRRALARGVIVGAAAGPARQVEIEAAAVGQRRGRADVP